MTQFKVKTYEAPSLRTFANQREVWDNFKDQGTPEERAALRQALGFVEPGISEAPPIRRRA